MANFTYATIALAASPSRVDELVEWVTSNVLSLSGCRLLVWPQQVAQQLEQNHRFSLIDPRLLSSLHVESVADQDGDVVLAGQVLAGEIKGVVVFRDYHKDAAMPDVNLLTRVCDTRNIPIALNRATADLVLRGVARTRTVYLIFNPVAGQGDAQAELDLIRSILEPTMIVHVIYTEKDVDVTHQAKQVVDVIKAHPSEVDCTLSSSDQRVPSAPSQYVIASGGDGTVSAVAGATMTTGIPFGVIPRGTANAFSVALGIPTTVEDACTNILAGHLRVIDGGLCNQTVPFVNLAGVGFEAGLVNNATRELKDALGNLAYMFGGAQQTLQQEPFRCVIRVDDPDNDDSGKEQTIQTKVVTVANVAPSSSIFAQGFGEVIPDDGLFEVTISTGTDALGELEALGNLFVSSVVRTSVPSNNVLRLRTKSISIEADPPQKLLLDGEVHDEASSVAFTIVPDALTVITPALKQHEQ